VDILLEPEMFDTICEHLPPEIQAPLRLIHITGWRLTSEVLPLTADRVNLRAGTVTLDPGTTKNERAGPSS
jgi:hypothetical protein